MSRKKTLKERNREATTLLKRAKAEVGRLRKAGWTQRDFSKALIQELK